MAHSLCHDVQFVQMFVVISHKAECTDVQPVLSPPSPPPLAGACENNTGLQQGSLTPQIISPYP